MSMITLAAAAAAALGLAAAGQVPSAPATKPTVVLVHGAFADSSSWNGVVAELTSHGYHVVAAANPLRGVKRDAAAVGAVLDAIDGPVVLVGHSYGGAVISAAAFGRSNVKSLVYVAAFQPDVGENSLGLSAKFPGSTLGSALAAPVAIPEGGVDLYIRQDAFPQQFAADIPAAEASVMAAEQRPIAQAALVEPQEKAAWRTIPSWSVYGTADRNIPPHAMAFMAERAGAKGVVVIPGASHVVMIAHPAEVARVIEDAAR